MSPDRRTRVEHALRRAFEAALPGLVDEVLASLEPRETSSEVASPGGGLVSSGVTARRERRDAALSLLSELLETTHTGGEAAVRAALERSDVDLRGLALVLDRSLADRSRRWTEQRLREELLQEILRRAVRGDVFRERDEGE